MRAHARTHTRARARAALTQAGTHGSLRLFPASAPHSGVAHARATATAKELWGHLLIQA